MVNKYTGPRGSLLVGIRSRDFFIDAVEELHEFRSTQDVPFLVVVVDEVNSKLHCLGALVRLSRLVERV